MTILTKFSPISLLHAFQDISLSYRLARLVEVIFNYVKTLIHNCSWFKFEWWLSYIHLNTWQAKLNVLTCCNPLKVDHVCHCKTLPLWKRTQTWTHPKMNKQHSSKDTNGKYQSKPWAGSWLQNECWLTSCQSVNCPQKVPRGEAWIEITSIIILLSSVS